MSTFELDPQLRADTFALGRCAGMHLLLHRSAQFPWFILVPETSVTELHELPPLTRAALNAAGDRIGRCVLAHFGSEKLNVAAIGNVVSQLHLHVIGRRRDDGLWPRPVWSNLTPGPLRDEADVEGIAAVLRRAQCLD